MRSFCFALALVCMLSPAGADGSGETSSSVVLHDGAHLERRLFSLSGAFSKATDMVSKAETWVADEGKKVAAVVGSALGIDKILQILKDGKKFVTDGLAMAKRGWQGMKDMVAALMSIFTGFAPLKPIFADGKGGILKLMSSKAHLKTLVSTLEGLLGTSKVMHVLSDALQKTAAMFHSISTFFKSLLSKVTGRRLQLKASSDDHPESVAWGAAERRLLDLTSLMSGLSFETIRTAFVGFMSQVAGFSTTLASLNATFAPALHQLGSMLGGGRRLGLGEMKAAQEKYAGAIKQVIPTWQGVESLGIKMCPTVLDAQESASSLSCRVQGFIDKTGLADSIPTLVSGCGADPATVVPPADVGACPATSMSAGIKDLIGENAGIFGWILAVGMGVLGVGGVGIMGAMHAMHGGGDEEEEEEEEEAEE